MAPKRSAKSIKDPSTSKPVVERPISKSKKTKRNYHSFSKYLYAVLKSINEQCGISRHSMLIMDNFVADMLEKIAVEAGRLIGHGKKSTLGSREIQTAVRLIIPGELAKHANIQGVKALNSYQNSRAKEAE